MIRTTTPPEQAEPERPTRRKAKRRGASSTIPFRRLIRINVGLKRFLKDLWCEIVKDDVTSGAAILAYFSMLAIFPAAILLLSLLPFLPIPNLEQTIMASLYQAMPGQAADLFTSTVTSVVTERRGGLLSISALGTVWAASSGIQAVMQQLSAAYDEPETRPYWKLRLIAIGLVFGVGILVIGAFGLVILGDILHLQLSRVLGDNLLFYGVFQLLRWTTILSMMLGALSLLYYFGPNVKQRYRLITPGGLLSTGLFILSCLLFRAYVEHFGSYEATYGSLGAAIVLLLWLYVGGLVILVGAEVNGLLESYVQARDKRCA
jgi:membrane protein